MTEPYFPVPLDCAFHGLRAAEVRRHIARMARAAHLTCAFPEGALQIADKLGDAAREYGLISWTTARSSGEWQIRIEGDEACLRRFAAEIGFRNLESALEP